MPSGDPSRAGGYTQSEWSARWIKESVEKRRTCDWYQCPYDGKAFKVDKGHVEHNWRAFWMTVKRRKDKHDRESFNQGLEKDAADMRQLKLAKAKARSAKDGAQLRMAEAEANKMRYKVAAAQIGTGRQTLADLGCGSSEDEGSEQASDVDSDPATPARLGKASAANAPSPSPFVAEVLARAGRSPKGREAQARAERGAVDQIAEEARTQMGGAQTPRAASPDDLQGQAAEDGAAAPSPGRSSSELALNQQINAKQGQQIETQNRLLDENAEENAQLQQHIASRDAMIAQLQRQAASRDTMVAALQSKLSTFISDATTDKKTMERLREERHQVTVERDEALSELRRRRQANGPPSPAVKTGPVPKRTSLKELR